MALCSQHLCSHIFSKGHYGQQSWKVLWTFIFNSKLYFWSHWALGNFLFLGGMCSASWSFSVTFSCSKRCWFSVSPNTEKENAYGSHNHHKNTAALLDFLGLEAALVWRTPWTKPSKSGPFDDASFVQKTSSLPQEEIHLCCLLFRPNLWWQ